MDKLFAFWRYDSFPYMLGGEVERMLPSGAVYIAAYRGSFMPIKLLPLAEGKALWEKLETLRSECKGAHFAVDMEYTAKLEALAPFYPRSK